MTQSLGRARESSCIEESVLTESRRVMVLVAHPDDEAIGCGILLQRLREPVVVFATDGAPHDEYFWGKFGSRVAYTAIRRQEARAALAEVGMTDAVFLDLTIDQELHLNLSSSLERLMKFVRSRSPEVLVTHAYEGGHPDHDSCAFLAAQIRAIMGIEVWEMPLYNRQRGEIALQQFPCGTAELTIEATVEELERKQRMASRYKSQNLTVATFDMRREQFRQQPTYDFSRPPHAGQLNYEAWQWRMCGSELCQRFMELASEESCRTHA